MEYILIDMKERPPELENVEIALSLIRKYIQTVRYALLSYCFLSCAEKRALLGRFRDLNYNYNMALEKKREYVQIGLPGALLYARRHAVWGLDAMKHEAQMQSEEDYEYACNLTVKLEQETGDYAPITTS